MTKYNEIMSLTNIRGKMDRMSAEERQMFEHMQVYVTEKIHGENFRVGIDENGRHFIGQRNVSYYKREIGNGEFGFFTDSTSEDTSHHEHPRKKSLSDSAWRDVDRILSWIEIQDRPYTFFGELFGNNVQKGFSYDLDKNDIVWYEIHDGDNYLPPDKSNRILDGLQLLVVPFVGIMTMKDLIETFDVESIKSNLAKEEYVEGVVARPYDNQKPDWWDFNDRLIVKKKIPRFAEQKQPDTSEKKKKEVYESPFEKFVVEERLIHVLGDLVEKGHQISEDKNFRLIVVDAMLENIKREENEGEEFSNDDKKAITKEIHRIYTVFTQK